MRAKKIYQLTNNKPIMAIIIIPIIRNFFSPFILFNSKGNNLFAISGDSINETISNEQIK